MLPICITAPCKNLTTKNLTTVNGVIVDEDNNITVTLHAHWDPIKYTVEYDVNGGNLPEDVSNLYTATYDKSFTLIVPTRGWYTFVGWYNESDKKVEEGYNLVSDPDGSIKLVAKWELTQYKITYKYVDEDEKECEAGKADFDILSETYTQPTVPYRKGYQGYWDFSNMPHCDE